MPPPFGPEVHGTDMVTIIVGQGGAQKRFTIHQGLITTSQHSNRVFEGHFRESSEKELNLPNDDPVILYAFYEWLYTGHVSPPAPSNDTGDPPLLFWLRLYIAADLWGMVDVQEIARSAIRKEFLVAEDFLPSPDFIALLFSTTLPNKHLERYVTRHCALVANNNELNWKPWATLIDASERFATAVALDMVKVKAKDYRKAKIYPELDARFDAGHDSAVDTDAEETEEEEEGTRSVHARCWFK